MKSGGKCPRGKACTFGHPPPCKYEAQGKCSMGNKCQFLHKNGGSGAPAPKPKPKAQPKPKPEPKAKLTRKERREAKKASAKLAEGGPQASVASVDQSDFE